MPKSNPSPADFNIKTIFNQFLIFSDGHWLPACVFGITDQCFPNMSPVSTTKICGTDNDFNRPSGTGVSLHRYRHFVGPKGRAPKGLEDSAQGFNLGFNPGNPPPRAIRPEGRQIEHTNNAKVGPIVARLHCAF
jgi:hypothetical protein